MKQYKRQYMQAEYTNSLGVQLIKSSRAIANLPKKRYAAKSKCKLKPNTPNISIPTPTNTSAINTYE